MQQTGGINASLKVSARGLAFIARYEGFSPTTYQDSAGKRSIGYGHKLGAGEDFPQPISRDQADMLMQRDLAPAENAIHTLVKVPLTQSQYDALVSLIYNIGAGAFADSSVLLLLNAANYKSAGDAFLKWNKIHEQGIVVESAGLSARRAAERMMFCESTA